MNNSRGVITLCDKKAEWMLIHWMRELRKHSPDMPVTLIDSGCTHKPLAEFREMGGRVLSCPRELLNYEFETMYCCVKGLTPYATTVYADLDVVVQGDLTPLFDEFERSRRSFGACADRYYPWTWTPPATQESNEYFPIMAGFVIYSRDSVVVQDWILAMKTWNRPPRIDGMHICADGKNWAKFARDTYLKGCNLVWRDDMQCLSMIYRIGHPMIWEMPANTQWFRLMGGSPEGYLVAHYTGADGKTLLKNERGWR